MYNIFINPLVAVAEFIFLVIYSLINSYGLSLLFLSFLSGLTIFLLQKVFAKYPEREKKIQSILQPKMEAIKAEYRGEQRHEKISKLYKQYSYNPLHSLRASIPVFVQLPFLLAAYFMLVQLEAIEGVRFLFINDLASPDRLLFGINLLPLIMTLVNIVTTFISAEFSTKQRIQAIVIALLFFVLLYNAPSALLIFWTMNNLIFLIRIIFFSTDSSLSFSYSSKTKKKKQVSFLFKKLLFDNLVND